jgi:antitoxin component YwqK of YwqJK toxin-antitoxin module
MKKQKKYCMIIIFLAFAIIPACKKKNTEYYPNGNIKIEFELKKGIKNGSYKFYYPTGILKEHSNYKENKLHGIKKSFYPDGTLRLIVDYLHGRENGTYYQYSEKSVLIIEAEFLDGKQNGFTNYYSENGQLEKKVHFENGNQNGDFFEYHTNEQLKMYAIQLNDEPKYYELYDTIGNLINIGRIVDFNLQQDTIFVGEECIANIKIYGPFNNKKAKIKSYWVSENKTITHVVDSNTYSINKTFDKPGRDILFIDVIMENKNYLSQGKEVTISPH